MRHLLLMGALAILLLLVTACGGEGSESAATTRWDLGDGVVAAFVEGLSPEAQERIAYLTHVPSGSQAVLDREGRVISRHDGRGDDPERLDLVLADEAAMQRIIGRLQSGEDTRPRPATILWVDAVRFGGITYMANWEVDKTSARVGEGLLTPEALAPELFRVAFRLKGYAGSSYRTQDGDATFLDPGTLVYAVKGHAPEFRLGAFVNGRFTVYEADTNPHAKTGEDLLDIRDKVTAIDVLSEEDATTVFATIDGKGRVDYLVGLVLESPVDQGRRDHDGPRYFLGFRLADGTSVVRSFWLESGELSRGIITDPSVTLQVWRALPAEHRPAATADGPKIYERLALRLGLAYLSSSAPELEVTGKPHSPVARLMRLSEFDTLISSVSVTPTDPLVWVVEAQGSWRGAGIVPEEARQDRSFGLVVFDADTGSLYARRHGNTPLL